MTPGRGLGLRAAHGFALARNLAPGSPAVTRAFAWAAPLLFAACVVSSDRLGRLVPCGDDADCPAGSRCVEGRCARMPCATGLECPPGSTCDTTSCVALECTSMSDCGPGVPCSAGVCGSARTCAADLDCDDGDPCTSGESCDHGTCRAGESVDCSAFSDPLTCVIGACEAGQCVSRLAPDEAPCDDGIFCTILDACFGGVCVGGPQRSCDDGDACTEDRCDNVGARCEHAPTVEGPQGDTTCADGLDNDCDGATDAPDPDCA